MAEAMRKREDIPEKYKWDLTHIYKDDAAWEADYQRLTGRMTEIAAFNGKVAEDPKAAIRCYFSVEKDSVKVYEYAFLRMDTDTKDPVAQGLKDRAIRLMVQLQTAGAFMEPELIAMDEEELKALAADPEMADYDAFLRTVLLNKAHTLSKDQEQLIAMMGEVAEAPDAIFFGAERRGHEAAAGANGGRDGAGADGGKLFHLHP